MLMVQCDFDDTVSVGNVSTAIRMEFGPDRWREMEEEYFSGRYSVEESNIRQFGLVQASKAEIDRFIADHVMVRPGFAEFVGHCGDVGLRIVVVSSGLDIYVGPTLRRLGLDDLEFHAARAEVTGLGIEVAYVDPWGDGITRGFKDSFAKHFKRSGYSVIYVGDGRSDIGPAAEADFVIARSTLGRHLRENGLPYYSFETFWDVRRHVDEIRMTTREID